MSERITYECDLTGIDGLEEGEVLTVPIRQHVHHPFNVTEREIHLYREALKERLPYLARPDFGDKGFVGIEYTDDGVEVVGYCTPYRSGGETGYPFEERDSVVGDHYEPFFELLESGEVDFL